MNHSENEKPENKPLEGRKHGRVALVPLQAGCLTMGLAMVAILVGLWLDARMGTTPRWTLILLVASAPIALGSVFLVTRRALRKMQDEMKASEADKDH